MWRMWIVGAALGVNLLLSLGGRDAHAQPAVVKEIWDKYTYPKYEVSGPISQSGNLHTLLITTGDDFDKVVGWYANITDKSLEKVRPGSIAASSDGISVQDVSSPSASIRILVQHDKSFSFTLMVSRAKDEKLTRIAMSYLKR